MFFQIGYDYVKGDSSIFLEINESELPFNRYDLNKPDRINCQVIECRINENGTKTDYIANTLSWLIVSERVKKIMEEFNMGQCDFIPVVTKEDKTKIGYVVHCRNYLNAFDDEKSEYKKNQIKVKERIIETINVYKYVIKPEVIDGLDIFRLNISKVPIFISQKLKEKFVNEGLTGFDFFDVLG